MRARDFREIVNVKMQGKGLVAALGYFIFMAIFSAISAASMGIGTLILTGSLTLGFVLFIIEISEGKSPQITTLFDGFKNFVNAMLLYIIQSIYLALWTMLLIIPGIVKSFSYAMTFYILKENPEMSPNAAITQSRQIMDGHKWRLFCLQFSYIGWILLSMLTFGILLFWVVPKIELAKYEFYLDLKEQK